MRTLNSSDPAPRRVVPRRCGLVSWFMMRLKVRFLVIAAAVAGLVLCAGAPTEAQNSSSSSSSSQQPTTAPPDDQAPPAPEYVQIDPLANVRYDNRYDLAVGLAYDHMKAGP